MRLGIVTPALTALPGSHAAWEANAAWSDVVDVVRAADRLGYDFITCSEHVAIPTEAAKVRGGTYWDPLATFGYLAAVTEHIRFATYVLVLGYHHPLEIAKRYGTLDVVAGGRLILGVGVGSLLEEFDLLDVPFDDRGARADEALVALRASLGVAQPEHHGRYYDFDGMLIEPHAPRRDIPIWIGGRSLRSLRRAAKLADGWAPFWLSATRIAEMIAKVEPPEGFQVVLPLANALDPIADPDAARSALKELADTGATHASLRFVHHSPAHYIEQLEATMELGS